MHRMEPVPALQSPEFDSSELSALIEIVIDDAIDETDTNPEHVALRVNLLPGGWVRIFIGRDQGARGGEVDFLNLLAATKRGLGGLDLSVASELVTLHGGCIVARPTTCVPRPPSTPPC